MYKIGIIGDRESTLCFLPLGYTVMEADAENAATVLKNAVKSEDFAVIFITEELAAGVACELEKYKDLPLPAITVIPGRSGGTGYGMASLHAAVERAVGADILK